MGLRYFYASNEAARGNFVELLFVGSFAAHSHRGLSEPGPHRLTGHVAADPATLFFALWAKSRGTHCPWWRIELESTCEPSAVNNFPLTRRLEWGFKHEEIVEH
jgi:hypothetical protein